MVSEKVTQFSVLLIENSDYDPNDQSPGGLCLNPLECATQDRIAIKKLLDSTNIDTINNRPIVAKNESQKQFMLTWSDYVADVKFKAKNGEVVAFVHYSGHGCIVENEPTQQTWICHKDPTEVTPIQYQLVDLSREPNVTVFALLDCCRNVQAIKSSQKSPPLPLNGQYYIGFGARTGKSAIAAAGCNSKFTDFFINFVKEKRRLSLPSDILMWEWFKWGEMSCNCQRNFTLSLEEEKTPEEQVQFFKAQHGYGGRCEFKKIYYMEGFDDIKSIQELANFCSNIKNCVGFAFYPVFTDYRFAEACFYYIELSPTNQSWPLYLFDEKEAKKQPGSEPSQLSKNRDAVKARQSADRRK